MYVSFLPVEPVGHPGRAGCARTWRCIWVGSIAAHFPVRSSAMHGDDDHGDDDDDDGGDGGDDDDDDDVDDGGG
eukprot:6376424-Pyramimonas_sp.AAC.1